MTSIESILHKGSAYSRFRIAVCVMREVLAAAPEAVCIGKLERAAGCSARTLARVCANLVQAGILSPADSAKAGWLPGPAANGVTLADILCSEIGYRDARRLFRRRCGGRCYRCGRASPWHRWWRFGADSRFLYRHCRI